MKQKNEFGYDQTKLMLETIRGLNTVGRGNMNEQVEPENQLRDPDEQSAQAQENTDFTVINNVEVVINSTDQMDFDLSEDEKGKISQIIDDFRTEISELVDFGKLQIYNNSAKLTGILNQFNINFMLSSGDDQGVFVGNSSLMELSREVLELLLKLEDFSHKFSSTIDDVIANRKQN